MGEPLRQHVQFWYVEVGPEGLGGAGGRRNRLVLYELLPYQPSPCPCIRHAGDQLIELAPPAGFPKAQLVVRHEADVPSVEREGDLAFPYFVLLPF